MLVSLKQRLLKVRQLGCCLSKGELKRLKDVIRIHDFDDKKPTLSHITKSSWFARLTLTVARGKPQINVSGVYQRG
jgi:hypothetical protein